MAPTLMRQSKLFRYRVSAPAACILVLMLSSGIVESGKQESISCAPESNQGHLQTVISPAIAPKANVVDELSFPEAGFSVSKASCCNVEYEPKRTALLAPCFMIWFPSAYMAIPMSQLIRTVGTSPR